MDEFYARKSSNASFSCNDTSGTCIYRLGMNAVHTRIKALREAKGWSMEQLGEAVGVSWQTVQQWENGKTAPKRARMEKVAESLGVSAQDLLYGESAQSLSEKLDSQAKKKTIEELTQELAARVVEAGIRTAEGAPGFLQFEIGKLIDQSESAAAPPSNPRKPPIQKESR